MTLKISLINMPFADLRRPSIALTQLKSVTEQRFGAQVAVSISYLNHEFGRLLGPDVYDFIADSGPAHVCGLGEWLFRQIAFPELQDNKATYLARYRHHLGGSRMSTLESQLERLRGRLGEQLDGLILRYRLHEADVVGLTSMFFQNLPSIALAQRLRRMRPDQLIVMGGANCEGTMGIELVAHVPVLDFVFSGHGLVSFPEFIGHVLQRDLESCQRIDGVFSRHNSRSVTTLTERTSDIDWSRHKPDTQLAGVASLGRELDINATIPLDYDEFLESLRSNIPGIFSSASIMFETSRGCWWGERAHCTFCGLNGGTMAYRAMQPERAIELINGLLTRYAGKVSSFDSVDNILPVEYVDGVIAKIRPPEHITLFYEVKSDLTGEQIATLARGGVRRVQPGIEALATSTLKLMRKGTTAFHGLRFLMHCKTHKVKPMWNLLLGFPGETAEVYENYAKILPSLFHLPPPMGTYPVRFDRFSPYFTLERQYGLRLAPYDYYELCYPFPAAALRNMAYYFQDLNYEAQYLRDVSAWLGKLRALTDEWGAQWGREPPRLELTTGANSSVVDDTRGGALHRYTVTQNEIELLRSLANPTRAEELSALYGSSLDKMKGKAFLFGERGRLMSLVSIQQAFAG